MNKFTLLPLLRVLGEGRVIRRLLTLIMQAFAVAALLLGVYAVVQTLRNLFQAGVPTEVVIAGILEIVVMAAMCLALAQIFWLRAGHVQHVPEGPYNLMPLASLFIRAGGEAYAVANVAMGLMGCLFLWITKENPLALYVSTLVPIPSDPNPFLGGLLFFVRCALGAGLGLLIAYFLAEVVLVIADICHHVRMTAGQSPTAPSPFVPVIPKYTAPAPPPQYPSPMQPYPIPQYPGAAPQYPEAPQYPGAAPQYPGSAPQYPGPPSPQYPGPPAPQYPGPPSPQYPAPAPQYPGAMPQQPTAPVSPRCPNCGSEVAPGAPYCGRCGNPLPGRPPGY